MTGTGTIFLSPSTQTWNAYTGQATNEQTVTLAICQAASKILTARGITNRVGTSGLGNPGSGYVAMADESNRTGPWTGHVCVHTDAGGATGTTAFSYPGSESSRRLAQAIYNRVAPLSPGTDHGVRERGDLWELNQTVAVAALIEIAPHDRTESAAWLTSHITTAAAALADGISDWLGVEYNEGEDDMQLTDTVRRPDGTETTVGAILAYGDERLERLEKFLDGMNIKMDEDRATAAQADAWRAADVAWIIETIRANPAATIEELAATLARVSQS